MANRIVLLTVILSCLCVPGKLLADSSHVRLVSASTGDTICGKAVVEDGRILVPLASIGRVGVPYTVKGTRLKFKGSEAKPIAVFSKSKVQFVRLDQVAEALDAGFSLDETSSTAYLFPRLKSVTLDGSTLRAKFTLPVAAPSIRVWKDPWRIAIDAPGTRLAMLDRRIAASRGAVSGIRLGQFDRDTSRIVVDVQKKLKYRLLTSETPSEIRLEIGGATLSAKASKLKPLHGLVIVLDPGHGGYDPGAPSDGVPEKTIDLAIAMTLKSTLAKAGAKVILTRETDVFVPLEDRPAVATAHSAGFFISLHCNSSQLGGATGIETYYSDSSGSFEFAEFVQASLVKGTGAEDRRARLSPGYTVLQGASIPAILIECGFVNDETEREQLCSEEYQKKLADAVLEGITSYRTSITHPAPAAARGSSDPFP